VPRGRGTALGRVWMLELVISRGAGTADAGGAALRTRLGGGSVPSRVATSSVRQTTNYRDRGSLPRLATSSIQLGALRLDGPQSRREAKDAVRTGRTEHRAGFPEHERAHGQELGSSEGGCEPARGDRKAVEA